MAWLKRRKKSYKQTNQHNFSYMQFSASKPEETLLNCFRKKKESPISGTARAGGAGWGNSMSQQAWALSFTYGALQQQILKLAEYSSNRTNGTNRLHKSKHGRFRPPVPCNFMMLKYSKWLVTSYTSLICLFISQILFNKITVLLINWRGLFILGIIRQWPLKPKNDFL